jgi:hypothetical protein
MRSQLTPEYKTMINKVVSDGGEKISNAEVSQAMLKAGMVLPRSEDIHDARIAVFGQGARPSRRDRVKTPKKSKTTKDGKLRPVEKLREIITTLGRHATSAEIRRHLTKDGYKETSGSRIKKIFEEIHGVTLVTQAKKIPKRTLAKAATAPATVSGVAAISDKMKYDLIQAKETAQLVGGLDHLIELATWLKNWQL